MKTEGRTMSVLGEIITDPAVVAAMLEQDLEATESRLEVTETSLAWHSSRLEAVEAELESVKQLLVQEQARSRRWKARANSLEAMHQKYAEWAERSITFWADKYNNETMRP
jgi:acyl carrier protein phosphodiesterase